MKFKLKLSIIALMILMLFTVSAVAADENITNEVSSIDQVSAIESVSVPETTQTVETQNIEVSTSDDIQDVTNEVTSDTQEIQNEYKNKNSKEVLKASNEDVLDSTVYVSGNIFYDLQNAINNAQDGDILDLGGQTFYYPNSINCNKNITIANGILDGQLALSSYNFINCRLENLALLNLHVHWGMSINYCNLTNVKFDNAVTDVGCTFAVRYCPLLENVTFSNYCSLMPADPNKDNNKGNNTTSIDPEADVKVIKTVSNPKPAR